MVTMAASASAYFVSNSFSYHDMRHISLQGTRASIDAHGFIKKEDASSWGLVVKHLTKAKARTIFLKPKVMLDQHKTYPYMVPDLGLEGMLEDGFVYRQNFPIRSYEVGSDQTVAIETLMNLVQETSINHMKAIGIWGDGLGLTREMCKKKLIWVVAKMQVVVDRYPMWGETIQVDTWKGAYGKNRLCSNWKFTDGKTGDILLRASCIYLMMNKETRRLSKFPDEVKRELDKHLTHTTPPTVKEDTRKLLTQDESILHYVRNGLAPRWSDFDANHHVNNAKYIGWILESVPYWIVENYELASITLEYCRECRKENVLQSHTYVMGTNQNGKLSDYDQLDCEHVLKLEIGDGEIMKGWTTWRSKHGNRTGLEKSG